MLCCFADSRRSHSKFGAATRHPGSAAELKIRVVRSNVIRSSGLQASSLVRWDAAGPRIILAAPASTCPLAYEASGHRPRRSSRKDGPLNSGSNVRNSSRERKTVAFVDAEIGATPLSLSDRSARAAKSQPIFFRSIYADVVRRRAARHGVS